MPDPKLVKIGLIGFNALILLLIFLFLLWKDNTQSKKSIAIANIFILLLSGLLFMQAGVYIYAQYIEPNWIKIENVHIINKNFPEGLSKLKIVQISDLHIRRSGFREQDMVRKINHIKPDIILITGDFISERRYLKELTKTLSQLKAKKGIYGILGDNDFYGFSDVLELKIALDNAGVKILDNENARIPVNDTEGLWLIGLSNPELNDEIVNKAYIGIPLAEPKIALSHYPQIIESGYIGTGNADLVLSGGTHGGQVGLRFIRDFFQVEAGTKYVSGLAYVNNVPLYVNRGIGSVGDMQADTIRFFCRPEITVITFIK